MEGYVIINEPMLLAGKHRVVNEKVGPINITLKIQELAHKGAVKVLISEKPIRRKEVKSGGSNKKLYKNTNKKSGSFGRHSDSYNKPGKGDKSSIFSKS